MSRILVVDDEPNIADVVTMALRFHGYAVETAGTGADALSAVTAFRPDLILRRTGLAQPESSRLTFEDLELDEDTREVAAAG